MNLLAKFEQQQIEELMQNKKLPEIAVGDTVKISVRISEGNNNRIQLFEGLVIAKKNRGLGSSIRVRKISYNEGVERTFMIFAPAVEKIEVVRKGIVRRAKLYYIRELSGKAARIKGKLPEKKKTEDKKPADVAANSAKSQDSKTKSESK